MNNAEYNKSSNWLFLATCILGYYFSTKMFPIFLIIDILLCSPSPSRQWRPVTTFLSFKENQFYFYLFSVQVSIYLCAAMEFKTKRKIVDCPRAKKLLRNDYRFVSRPGGRFPRQVEDISQVRADVFVIFLLAKINERYLANK
jgi:hypothetical protein